MKPIAWKWLAGFLLWIIGLQLQAQPSAQSQVQQFLQAHPDLRDRQFRLEWPREAGRLPPCTQALVFHLGSGVKPLGWTALSVRCPVASGWERTVQIRVHWVQRYLAAGRNLMPGHLLTAEDLVWAEGEAAHLGAEVVQDLSVVLGQELRRPLPKGSPLRLNTLRPVTVIKQGSKVVLLLRGPGFEIEAEGQALDNAPLGGTVRVQIKEGTIIPAKVTAAGVAEAQ